MIIATEATKQFLKGQFSTVLVNGCKVVDFEFTKNSTKYIAILSNEQRIPDYHIQLFRGENKTFQKYLDTFKRIEDNTCKNYKGSSFSFMPD